MHQHKQQVVFNSTLFIKGNQFAILANIHHQLVPKATGFQKGNLSRSMGGGKTFHTGIDRYEQPYTTYK